MRGSSGGSFWRRLERFSLRTASHSTTGLPSKMRSQLLNRGALLAAVNAGRVVTRVRMKVGADARPIVCGGVRKRLSRVEPKEDVLATVAARSPRWPGVDDR